MPWSPGQIKAAAIASRHAGWDDADRQTVLRQFGNRAVSGTRCSSKSPELNQDDFEQFMATAEEAANGQLPGKPVGYWWGKAGDRIQRQRHRLHELRDQLDLTDEELGGMIHRATGGLATSVEDLDRLNDRVIASKVLELLKAKQPSQPTTVATTAQTDCHRPLDESEIPF